jgi:hypothetical protein
VRDLCVDVPDAGIVGDGDGLGAWEVDINKDHVAGTHVAQSRDPERGGGGSDLVVA